MRYGHFDEANLEYVIDRVDAPASWVNYLGVRDWCALTNQSAGGYSFFRSSERGRVTRFRPNAVPKDGPGRWVYLRDDDTGDFWTVTWQPVGKPLDQARCRARHGLSYSVFECAYSDIEASQTVFVPVADDGEVWDVTVRNASDRTRRLSLFGYCEFSYHDVQLDNENFQMSAYSTGATYADGVIEEEAHYRPGLRHFFTATRPDDGFDTLRDSFVGTWGDLRAPRAVVAGQCAGSTGTTLNHVGALRHAVVLEPGQSVRFAYLLGFGDRQAGAAFRAKYAADQARDDALADLRDFWADKRAAFAVATPNAALDALVGTWTLYQAETCVVWSRFASFVEVGGRTGLGYRDTAQDVMSVVHTNPAKTRQRLLELLRGQTSQGYGLHLFDPLAFEAEDFGPEPTVVPGARPPLLHGIADACSDDHLWLAPSLIEWVKETGDLAFLDEVVPFADTSVPAAERLEALGAEAAARFDPAPAAVYDHLLRAAEFTAEHVGANGIAQGLRADWNDCLNLGGGQSALVAFLHAWSVDALIEATEALIALGRPLEAELARLREIAAQVAAATERELWDGDWYVRGFTAEGRKIGSAESAEGKIFLEHMPWAVIAGTASRERGRRALDAVHEHLASPVGLHLNWPSYTAADDSIGFVTRVYPGVKENGAVFSHPNAWPIIAEAILGRGDRAMEYYDALAPYWQNDDADRRVAEPYVYAQFVYGRDHALHGRAENPWLTG
ncbi:MAG: hypothetical protein LBS56_09115, partial [Propionibacteriaceae bacterium]|nr:hypothetical protein [Propionibacteriaceae bacterium]